MRKLQSNQSEIATATPVWHELLFGCFRLLKSPKRRTIEDYLQTVIWPSVPILPYDVTAAGWHAEERARLVSKGKTPAFVDGQIASIAKTNDLCLVTANIKDFSVFEGLRLENWFRR